MKNNGTMRKFLLGLELLLLISLPTYGQSNGEIFLVRKETSLNRVYAVSGLGSQEHPSMDIDSFDFKGRVLYNGCGMLYSVSRDDDWQYYLDSASSGIPTDCSDSNQSTLNFSKFLRYEAKNAQKSIISGFERGQSELKCSEKYCVAYYNGLRIFQGQGGMGDVILPRVAAFGGTWTFDFFREKYLVLVAHYYNANPAFESHAYVFDLEKRTLLWRHKVADDFQLLDVKVVQNDVYVLFRQVTSEIFSIPPTPSRCVVVTLQSVGKTPTVTVVRGFDESVIEIL
ncbi:MAG: hypothetical protein IPP17_22905 [Bacteroidetes bacterium]|nr:hypothetical protein [Bacteroidota bacterium]